MRVRRHTSMERGLEVSISDLEHIAPKGEHASVKWGNRCITGRNQKEETLLIWRSSVGKRKGAARIENY